VYYKCVKFHKNPISRLGGVALTRYGQGDSYIPHQTLFAGGIQILNLISNLYFLVIKKPPPKLSIKGDNVLLPWLPMGMINNVCLPE
jgi:hypothetical protein